MSLQLGFHRTDGQVGNAAATLRKKITILFSKIVIHYEVVACNYVSRKKREQK